MAALAYAAAKAALATYSKGLAGQVARDNVRVNLVSPGVIETSALAARIRVLADQAGTALDTARRDFISSFNIPLGRPGTADDVAALVTFLVSPSALYVTTRDRHPWLSAEISAQLRSSPVAWPRRAAPPFGHVWLMPPRAGLRAAER